MKKLTALDHHDLEHLIVTVETSLKIHKRSQFFLWAQGALQGFIPHQTLLCAYGDITQMRFQHEIFSRAVMDAQAEHDIGDPVNGLLPRIIDDWLRGGSQPRLLCPVGESQVGRRQLLADIHRRNFGQVAAHGPREIQGEAGSFFVFMGLDNPTLERNAYVLELLMPYLHMALYRMLEGERSGKPTRPGTVTLLSKREIQVLHWVKHGKTNQEIGQILGISPITAKNHVQKIMRKLKVNNRAQAVGKSATLRLVPPSEAA